MTESLIELKHLTPYLPYALKYIVQSEIICLLDGYECYEKGSIQEMDLKSLAINEDDYLIKPILRPLSDLSKQIEYNGDMFTPIGKIRFDVDSRIYFNRGQLYIPGDIESYEIYLEDIRIVYDLLFEWHFDVFGLIEKGFAVDINTIES